MKWWWWRSKQRNEYIYTIWNNAYTRLIIYGLFSISTSAEAATHPKAKVDQTNTNTSLFPVSFPEGRVFNGMKLHTILWLCTSLLYFQALELLQSWYMICNENSLKSKGFSKRPLRFTWRCVMNFGENAWKPVAKAEQVMYLIITVLHTWCDDRSPSWLVKKGRNVTYRKSAILIVIQHNRIYTFPRGGL